MFRYFSFASLDIGRVFNLFTKQLVRHTLCSCRWQGSLGTICLNGFSVYCKFSFSLRCTETLRKLM
jgi:hypothetical protein